MKKKRRPQEFGVHAINLGFIRDELVPWILAKRGGEPPRTEEMARCLHTRYQANEAGQALAENASNLAAERAHAMPSKTSGSVGQRLLQLIGGPSTRSAEALESVDLSDQFGRFSTDRTVLGRPFFIDGNTSQELRETIQKYLRAGTDEDVHSLIKIMASRLQIRPDCQQRSAMMSLSTYDKDGAQQFVATPLIRLRDEFAKQPEPADGEPRRRINTLESILTELVRAAAHLGASWLLRGGSPSSIVERSRLTFLHMEDAFCFTEELLPLMPWLGWDIQQVLERCGVGAVIEAQHVAAFRCCLHENQKKGRATCSQRDWQLLDECLVYAQAEGLDVVESWGLIRSEEGCLP